MRYWNKICCFLIIFLFTAFFLHAQAVKNVWFNAYAIPKQKNFSPKQQVYFSNLLSVQVIPSNYYTQHFGFFCKKELAVEKITKVPFRFRLGSLQQCNYYEGKK